MPKSFFITGTDTDTGKTIITAGIALKAIEAGIKTAIVKPVQTGTDEYPTDIETIKSMVEGLYPLPETVEIPFHYKLAASPHLAAEVENRSLSLDDVVKSCRAAEQIKGPELMLFEGAGGLYVPLNSKATMLDLIKELDHPVVIATDAKLGTINHTMLSVMALKGAGAKIAGIIVNNMPDGNDIIAGDNIKTIEKHSGIPVIAVIPKIKNGINQDKLSQAFTSLDINKLLNL